jgi:hypothetical protein
MAAKATPRGEGGGGGSAGSRSAECLVDLVDLVVDLVDLVDLVDFLFTDFFITVATGFLLAGFLLNSGSAKVSSLIIGMLP